MIKPEVLDAMVAAGCTAEQIAAAVKADMSARSTNAERQARFRANKKGQGVTSNVTPVTERNNLSPKERSPTPPKEITPIPVSEPDGSSTDVSVRKARASDLSDFRSECSDLDAERLDAIIKHRRSKNGQLTGHAARLFRRDAEACGLTLPEAVDTCISRNWITVKPEYLRDRKQQTTAPPRERSVSDVFREIAAGTYSGPSDDDSHFQTIDASFSRRN